MIRFLELVTQIYNGHPRNVKICRLIKKTLTESDNLSPYVKWSFICFRRGAIVWRAALGIEALSELFLRRSKQKSECVKPDGGSATNAGTPKSKSKFKKSKI